MRGLWLAVVLASLSLGAFAETPRDETLRQYFEGNNSSRAARIGSVLSTPCSCSDGESLAGTGGLIFNCICGSMQCVVVGPGPAGQNGNSTHSLVCR
jgi:hypothetical protein